MPSTYTVNLGIEKIATGEQSGTWGDTTNTNLDLIDEAINGVVVITLASAGTSGSPNTLAITNGTSSNGRNKFIEFTDGGDLGATAYVQLTPNDAEKIVHIRNSLSGSRSILIFQGTYNASNDFEIPNGADVVLKFDGAGAGAVVSDVNVNLTPTKLTTADLVATTADINGGTIDGTTINDTTIGGSTPAAGSFTTFTSTGIDDNATSTAITIDSSENVGIGATSIGTTQRLLVKYVPTADFTASTNTAYNHLTVQGNNNGYAGITIASPNTDNQEGGLAFADTASGNVGLIQYSHSDDKMAFYTNETEAMRINSSGNVGIGTSSPNERLHVIGNHQLQGNLNFFNSSPFSVFQIIPAPGIGGTNANTIKTVNTTAIAFETGGSEHMRLDTSGNLKFNSGFGSVGTAYGCRAWVNFNGTGSVAIRASGNISSITDVGSGNYQFAFANAMPDDDYSVCTSTNASGSGGIPYHGSGSLTTTSFRVRTSNSGALVDNNLTTAAVFR